MDFPEKRASTKVKYLLSICQILRNFTEGNERKFTVILFALCAHADVIRYPKTLTFFFERAQIFLSFRPLQRANDRKTIGSHLNPRFQNV